MTDASSPAELRATAARYREMIKFVSDPHAIQVLLKLADEYEVTANWSEKDDPPPRSARGAFQSDRSGR
jgi:hypothetical protein